jgi:DNA-binding GntR family transcriptional regulator
VADTNSQKTSLVDAAVQTLRSRILEGELGPGVQLREVELSRELGIGRHSLRAALQALTHEGLVRHEPNRGAFVPRLTVDDVEDLFRLRLALESEAGREVAGRREPIPAMDAILGEMRKLDGREPWPVAIELDLAFHRALIEAVGSPRMQRAFAAIQTELRLLLAQMRSGYADPLVLANEHEPVRDALAGGKPSAATAAIRKHLEDGIRDLRDAITRPAVAAVRLR